MSAHAEEMNVRQDAADCREASRVSVVRDLQSRLERFTLDDALLMGCLAQQIEERVRTGKPTCETSRDLTTLYADAFHDANEIRQARDGADLAAMAGGS